MAIAKVSAATICTSTLKPPKVSIQIAVDTSYVAGQAGKDIKHGIYMMDNMAGNGSLGEGTLELTTACKVGDLIGFNVLPINYLTTFESVVITGFATIFGNVFTSAGTPQKQVAPSGEPDGAYWVGQAMRGGSSTYEIKIKVTVGQLQPQSYFISWYAHIIAN
jgi:hypothetical protein